MKRLTAAATSLVLLLTCAAKSAEICSPDGSITATLSDLGDKITLSASINGIQLLAPSDIALDIAGLNHATKIKKHNIYPTTSETIDATLYRQKQITVSYNKAVVTLDNGTEIEMRAYDEGIAYRYVTAYKDDVIVTAETADLRLPSDLRVWLPYSTNDKKPEAMAFQNVYDYTNISHAKDKLAFLPATIEYSDGVKMTITESDLEAYPGMFVKADTTEYTLKAVFAKYPKTYDYYPWRVQQYVTSTEDYIAKTTGKRTYPWRIMAITTQDTQMPVNNLVYALASPSRISDTSWIKGGKVAWEWWNDWGLTGVDFEAGINMDTYKYYIDFASDSGLEYVVLDEGWYESKGGDMLTPIPAIDVQALVDYAKKKNVGIVLWCVFNVLDDRIDEICKKYSAMGIKGFKVDFLDRDDQTAVEMAYRIAEKCAEYKMLLDYHGIYKPTGINRTYPNIINFESVFGMEESKWTTIENDMPLYDVTFPYIRLLAGYVDFTPGAMRNATKADWKAIYSNPVSQGTRCHQVACYIVYDSPFTMLCDSPTLYQKEKQTTEFIVDIPTEIDETRILAGEVGKYIVSARRVGEDWWIGGLTNWEPRDVEVDLSILSEGNYDATIMADGTNAHKNAQDYKYTSMQVNKGSKIKLHMAPGGGFAIRLIKK